MAHTGDAPGRPRAQDTNDADVPNSVEWDHAVQFYESDDFLCQSVAEFLTDGLLSGDPLVVISTRDHRDAVIERMAERGASWSDAVRNGRLAWMDARETLEKIMIGRAPDVARFDTYIGDPIREARSPGGRVRAYGEMVDLLWREGYFKAALELEDLGNGLGQEIDFSLLCAYSRGNLYREINGQNLRELCARHARVMPPEAGDPELPAV